MNRTLFFQTLARRILCDLGPDTHSIFRRHADTPDTMGAFFREHFGGDIEEAECQLVIWLANQTED